MWPVGRRLESPGLRASSKTALSSLVKAKYVKQHIKHFKILTTSSQLHDGK